MTLDAPRSNFSEYTNSDNKINNLAKSSLDKFEEIASIANKKLAYYSNSGSNVFASKGDKESAYNDHVNISSTNLKDYEWLATEPSIARIVIQYLNTKEIKIFYVCRRTIPNGVNDVLSYRSDMGKIVPVEIGKEYDLGEVTDLQKYDDQKFVLIQRAYFNPHKNKKIWDSSKTKYQDINSKKIITINSLRKILEEQNIKSENISSQILMKESNEGNLTYNSQRDIIETLSLRDQPILDQYQDTIFRLPLQHSLLLLGPAGAGKTTTLIRRLGQKLDFEIGLTDSEKELIRNISERNKPYEKNWLMFTPTELLKSYLQEAFNREGITAPDRNITTWEAYRYTLGREFKILYTPNNTSGFHYEENANTLINGYNDSIDIYNDFYKWIIGIWEEKLIKALARCSLIETIKDSDVFRDINKKVRKRLQSNKNIFFPYLRHILNHKKEIQELYTMVKNEIDNILHEEWNRQLNANRQFQNDLYFFIKSLELENEDSIEDEDNLINNYGTEEISSLSEINSKKVQNEYYKAVLALSQQKNNETKKPKETITSNIIKWLDKKIPTDSTLIKLNELNDKANIIGFFHNPIKKFFNSINTQYRKFRKLRQTEQIWYNPDSALKKTIDATEFDILILANLMFSHRLLNYTDIYSDTSNSWLSILEIPKNRYVYQVLVDEAPDFSPLQLGCMKLLSHPQVNSFFACGDFNQRLTSTGSKSREFLKSFLLGTHLDIHEITIPYRQSSQLYNFSTELLKIMPYAEIPRINAINLPEEYPPVLGKQLTGKALATWISDRIVDIEKILGTIPSIAILVPDKEYVDSIYQDIKKALFQKTSALVEAFSDGQARGNEEAVRIFDIKHIKGLEFQAAFFVSIDKLEELYPDLFWNYLYVGASRATTFLGISYEKNLPKSMEKLKHHFVNTWPLQR